MKRHQDGTLIDVGALGQLECDPPGKYARVWIHDGLGGTAVFPWGEIADLIAALTALGREPAVPR